MKKADIIYADTQHGKEVLLFNRNVTITCYSDSNYQVFYTIGDTPGNYVLDKKKKKVASLSVEGWNKLLLKIQTTVSNFAESKKYKQKL